MPIRMLLVGCPSWQEEAWSRLESRWPFSTLFRPAIEYAEAGFAVSPLTAARWASSARNYASVSNVEELRGWFDTFTRGGRAPGAGELWSSVDIARTLRILAETEVD